MKKKILTVLVSSILMFSCTGCDTTSYQETQEVANTSAISDSFSAGYFTTIARWGTAPVYRIVYANDTKVKYFVLTGSSMSGISPLYNADGTLQLYQE